MAVIKNLAFYPKYKIKNAAAFNALESIKSGFLPFPFDIVHYFLPLSLKFSSETFVALDKGKIKGVISLEREGGNFRRFKITRFFLEENSLATGEQLVNFVISKYCALGANSFQVVFTEEFEHMLDLFVNKCKFRICAYEFIYKTSSDELCTSNEFSGYFNSFKGTSAKAVCELHNSSLNSHQRHAFIKHPKHFQDRLFAPLGKNVVFRYVFENEDTGGVHAYFTLSTSDNLNYRLEVILSPAFDSYFTDIINFASREISRRSKNWNLYIKIKSCYINSQNLQHLLETHKFSFYRKNFILTKDFLRPQKQEGTILNNARIIFNNTAAEL